MVITHFCAADPRSGALRHRKALQRPTNYEGVFTFNLVVDGRQWERSLCERTAMALRIEDYAMIGGDCETAALAGRDGLLGNA